MGGRGGLNFALTQFQHQPEERGGCIEREGGRAGCSGKSQTGDGF